MVILINLAIGAGFGAIAFLAGALNVPLSIAVAFGVAAALNMAGLRRT